MVGLESFGVSHNGASAAIASDAIGAAGLALQAVDGTKLEAAASGLSGWGKEYMEKPEAALDAALNQIELAQEKPEPAGYRLPAGLAEREALRAQIKSGLAQWVADGRSHYHPVEPEARRMKVGQTTRLAYNAQAVLDAQEGIIVACEAVRQETDTGQLVPMIEQARENAGGGGPVVLTFSCIFALIARVNEPESALEPLPYHVELRDYLKSEERELWNWFASARAKADYTENLRLELLKSTYRLDADGHPELHKSLDEAKARLQLDIPVTLYQAQNSPHLNAALFFMPGQGHIVFSGPMFTLLNTDELKSVIGHELAHYHLWARDAGEYHISDRLIQAVAGDPRASTSHEQTARRYQLYTEIFADRGSLCVTGDASPVVAGLVKIQTGLSQVSAASYLKQAEEIFANGNVATEGLSHPEAFIRARALTLWKEQQDRATEQIRGMIEGAAGFEELDLVGQKRLTSTTRRLVECLLRPKWFQTSATLGHAKLFFSDFRPGPGNDESLHDALKFSDAKLREYVCYVLLDFTKVDPDLDEAPLAAALQLSSQLDMAEPFEKLAAKELKMKVRDLRRIKEQAAEMLAKAEANGE